LLPLTTDHYLTHVEFYTTRDLYLRMENEDQEKAKAHHHHTLVIALSVPFSILGAALLGAGGVLLYKRRQSRSKIASKLADE
jgi:LPXTG-motif cell wall-anchored protein